MALTNGKKEKIKISSINITHFWDFDNISTYYDFGGEKDQNKEILSKSNQEKIKKQNLDKNKDDKDIFYNVEYTGLVDLSGNRYIIRSKQAYLDELNSEIVYMENVSSIFYFKDDTILYVYAEKGVYNNKTLNMVFQNNVKANYLDNELFAQKAEYSNLKAI